MNSIQIGVHILSGACYTTSFMMQLLAMKQKLLSQKAVIIFCALGVLFHAWTILDILLENTINGVSLTLLLTTLSGLLATLICICDTFKKHYPYFLISILPCNLLTLVVGIGNSQTKTLLLDSSIGITMHVLFSLIAYGSIVLSSFQAIFLAYQKHKIHQKQQALTKLPSLQSMEKLLFKFLSIAVSFLSLSLISGFILFHNTFDGTLLPKTVLSLISWVLFSGLLIGRSRFGWSGQIATTWTLTGFSLLILAYVGWHYAFNYHLLI